MSNVSVNYTSLLASTAPLENSAEISKNKTRNLSDIREDIQNLGKSHDNCFGNLTDDIEYDLNNAIEKITQLSNDIMTTVNIFSQTELANMEGIKITSIGLNDALKSQYSNTFNEELTGYDFEYYQKLFNKVLSMASDERAKSTMAAIFLATSFPHMNYFWGGGHDKICNGLDPTWGQPKVVTAEGSESTGTERPNSLDCSGYVSWALKNGGYNIEGPMTTWDLEKIGNKIPITAATQNNIQAGDLASMEGHIGMIIKVDGNEITVSHCSGTGGMSITKMNTATGLVTEDWNKEANRVGQPYFTDIIKVNYNV